MVITFVLLVSAIVLGFLGWILLILMKPNIKSVHEVLEGATDSRDAVFAASFNPCHNGHMLILKAIARRHRFGTVYAVVGFNKKKRYPVSVDERVALLKLALGSDPELKNVQAVVVEGYIWKFAFKLDDSRKDREVGNCILYRGIRSWSKDGKDERWLHVLNLVGPTLLGWRAPPETRFVSTEGDVRANVSSTLVRSHAVAGVSINELVPAVIGNEVMRLYSRESRPPT